MLHFVVEKSILDRNTDHKKIDNSYSEMQIKISAARASMIRALK